MTDMAPQVCSGARRWLRHRLARSGFAAAILFAASGVGLAAPGDHIVYRTRAGDTLIGIGGALLQRPADWPKLQRLNRVADPRRMPSGAALRIPVELLRRQPQSATVAQLTGSARRDGRPLAAGERIAAGSAVATDDGYLTLELPDGSTLTLQPRSRLKVDELYRHGDSDAQRAVLRLDSGRLEAAVPKRSAPGRVSQRVRTPGAVISVRGTRYRAAVEDDKASRVEVTEGLVAVDQAARRPLALAEGFGLLAGAAGARPTPLLPAPDLSATAELQERPVLALNFAALPGARGYRVQVAADPRIHDIRADRIVEATQAKVAGLEDGDYWLRVRGVDGAGFEGLDQVRVLRLRARPEPPFPSAPADGARLRAQRIQLSWTQAVDAAAYEVQLAADSGFRQILHRSEAQAGTGFAPAADLPPGQYYWRVASLRADAYRGPFGDVQRFELRPPPADPEPPVVDAGHIAFAWPAEPGQRFEFQLARDAAFAEVFDTRQLGEPRIVIDRPAPGTYYLRVRATDPDGFVGPYTATQRLEVPPARPWWLLLLLLVPLL
jgi:hypothetical protein